MGPYISDKYVLSETGNLQKRRLDQRKPGRRVSGPFRFFPDITAIFK